MKRINQRVCLFLAICVISASLSSCGLSSPSMNKIQNKLKMKSIQDCRCGLEIDFSIPNERFDYTYVGNDYESNDPWDLELAKFTYRGVDYTDAHITKGYTTNGEYREPFYWCRATDPYGEDITITFTDIDKAPLVLSAQMSHIYGEPCEGYETSDAIKLGEEFIEDFINKNSSDSVKLSDYDLRTINAEEARTLNTDLRLCYERFYNGVLLHTITLDFNDKCQITRFKMSAPLFDKKIDKQICKSIPDLTDEQYLELAQALADEAYGNCNENFNITDLKIREDLNSNSHTLIYLQKSKCFAVKYTAKFVVTLPDGATDDHGFEIYYPLDEVELKEAEDKLPF